MADISISEITSFLRCRRAWDYGSSNRQALKKIGIPRATLNVGTLVHAGIAAMSDPKLTRDMDTTTIRGEERDWRIAVGCNAIHDLAHTQMSEYIAWTEATGTLVTQDEISELNAQEAQAMTLLQNYVMRYGPMGYPDFIRLDAIEQTFRVPIPGTDGFLIGTLDRLMQNTETSEWFVGEIKTYKTTPNYETLKMRPQFTAYAWAAQQLLGEPVRSILYDGVSQKLPAVPEMLRNGHPSLAVTKLAATSAVLFNNMLQENNLGDNQRYQEILHDLAMRDTCDVTPFYARYQIDLTQAQVMNFALDLPNIYREMQTATVYPNFTHTCAWDCWYTDLCHAQQLGEDTTFLKETQYTSNEGSQSFRRRDGEEVEVDASSFASA